MNRETEALILLEELKLEVGEDEITDETKKMLMQKYGLIAPQLTASEKNLIAKEERKNGRN